MVVCSKYWVCALVCRVRLSLGSRRFSRQVAGFGDHLSMAMLPQLNLIGLRPLLNDY